MCEVKEKLYIKQRYLFDSLYSELLLHEQKHIRDFCPTALAHGLFPRCTDSVEKQAKRGHGFTGCTLQHAKEQLQQKTNKQNKKNTGDDHILINSVCFH